VDDSRYTEVCGGEVKNYPEIADSESKEVGAAMDAPQLLEVAPSRTSESLERGPDPVAGPIIETSEILLGPTGKENFPFHGRVPSLLHPRPVFKIEYCSSMKST
jgi:hypothetical protein